MATRFVLEESDLERVGGYVQSLASELGGLERLAFVYERALEGVEAGGVEEGYLDEAQELAEAMDRFASGLRDLGDPAGTFAGIGQRIRERVEELEEELEEEEVALCDLCGGECRAEQDVLHERHYECGEGVEA